MEDHAKHLDEHEHGRSRGFKFVYLKIQGLEGKILRSFAPEHPRKTSSRALGPDSYKPGGRGVKPH